MSLVVIETDELKTLIGAAVEEAVSAALGRAAPGPQVALLSGARMAKRLGISRATLHRMRVAGCPAVKLGDSFKFEPEQVLVWLKTRDPNG